MAVFSAIILDAPYEVDQRLADWGLDRDQFVSIAQIAFDRKRDASSLMPQNAPGTLAYIYGVEALRNELIDVDWKADRYDGVEVVVNAALRIRIGYHNVDAACDPLFPPRPNSAKGKAAERMSGQTLWEFYGMEPGPVPDVAEDGFATYFVMVGDNGSVELSKPVIKDGTYAHFDERIFIHTPDDNADIEIQPDTGPIDDFDVPVKLKSTA